MTGPAPDGPDDGLARTAYEVYARALGIDRTQGYRAWPDLDRDRTRAWRAAAAAIGVPPGLAADLRLLLDAADTDYLSTDNLPALEEAIERLWAAAGGEP